MSFEQFEDVGFYFGLALLIGFMAFIIWDLAKKSNAGKVGYIALFCGLGIGMLGFIIKGVLTLVMGI